MTVSLCSLAGRSLRNSWVWLGFGCSFKSKVVFREKSSQFSLQVHRWSAFPRHNCQTLLYRSALCELSISSHRMLKRMCTPELDLIKHNLYSKKYKSCDSNCSSCSSCVVLSPPPRCLTVRPRTRMTSYCQDLPPQARELFLELSKALCQELTTPSSLQTMTDWSWCLTILVHPPSGGLALRPSCPTPFPRFSSSRSLWHLAKCTLTHYWPPSLSYFPFPY